MAKPLLECTQHIQSSLGMKPSLLIEKLAHDLAELLRLRNVYPMPGSCDNAELRRRKDTFDATTGPSETGRARDVDQPRHVLWTNVCRIASRDKQCWTVAARIFRDLPKAQLRQEALNGGKIQFPLQVALSAKRSQPSHAYLPSDRSSVVRQIAEQKLANRQVLQ